MLTEPCRTDQNLEMMSAMPSAAPVEVKLEVANAMELAVRPTAIMIEINFISDALVDRFGRRKCRDESVSIEWFLTITLQHVSVKSQLISSLYTFGYLTRDHGPVPWSRRAIKGDRRTGIRRDGR